MSSDIDEIIFGIGGRFASERERLGYTQKQLAGRLGTTERTLIDYESSKTPPKVPSLLGFWALGADIGYIVTGTRSVPTINEQSAQYRTPATSLGAVLGGMTLSQEDADLLLAMAKRLAGQ